MQNETKSPNHMRFAVAAGVAVIVAIPFIWYGCGLGEDEVEDGVEELSANENGEEMTERSVSIADESTCVTLYAGQSIDAGTVCVSVNNDVDTSAQCEAAGTTGALSVVYTTTGGWELTEAHLAAGDELSDIPVNRKGNPKIGNFPYNSGDITGATAHTFSVPLCEFGLDGAAETCDPVTAYLAAHAALRKDNGDGTWETQTGWGDGDNLVDQGSWAMFFNMILECDDDPEPPPVEECETSFAKAESGTCFIGADFDGDGNDDGFSRWGWSNGPFEPGMSETWPVYAAAGQCDISKGTLVGNIAVAYGSDGTASLTFDHVGDFVLDEQHIHVGNEPLARDVNGEYTVAPGQYGIVEDLENATHMEKTISGLDGPIYVVYHAVACGTY